MVNLLVYSDWRVFVNGSVYLNSLGIPYTVTKNLEEYLNTPAKFKVAITARVFDQVIDNDEWTDFAPFLKNISQSSDLVFLNDHEVHQYADVYPQIGDNVYWLVPAKLNNYFDKNIIFNGGWFRIVSNLYQQLPHRIDQLNPYQPKEKLFDALLGLEKPHRTFIYESIKKNNLEDVSIVSYSGKTGEWLDEPGVIRTADLKYSNDMVVYDGIETAWSQIIPISVYNQTAYSLIAETEFHNSYSFFTEKTAKPMLSRRLFVPFCGYRFLANLKAVGFKTFDTIIDESFDQIEDHEERWSRAFDQVIKLASMDQQEVLDRARPILEHNYQHCTEINWFENSVYGLLGKVRELTST